ncbi:MAG: DUF5522 domain-containing protein [Erythrobacter sp.]|uniref:Dph6-related ATP pyrophosphatase n=1 Tax=Erythrobacter sp. TaxID=1042 RepID=UPI00262C1E90|nr:DUF5522 domain-containing protein [Erythrobacter sp.]MDJ0979181.1 DUF5522 domain-containing protein [Erythrobacter sp.]
MSQPDYWDLHEAAVARGETTYTDPETGHMVFTRLGLAERDQCCGAGCRHCPFGHESVHVAMRARRIQQAAWLSQARPDPEAACTLLFWSGGKDSFLALRALKRQGVTDIALVTSFDVRSRVIAHREFAIDAVTEQAAHLGLPLIGVPLHPGGDYLDQIAPALDLAPGCDTLAFGDLHLDHIRQWREETFGGAERKRSLALSFPLWKADYADLIADLEASGARCAISAITAELPGVHVGDLFDRALMERLPESVDRFGENGEFHTRIAFPSAR